MYVDARKVSIHQQGSPDRVKGRLLMASIRGPGNRGWGHTRESAPIERQFRSVSINIVERRVSHLPKAEDATDESITMAVR
jgi:hypothetical protein